MRRLGRALATLLVLACIGVAAVPAFGIATGRFRFVPVLSGSMDPALATGDLAWVEPRPLDELAVGDVLVFESPASEGHASRRTIHRVIELVDPGSVEDPRPGTRYVRTQGDANEDPDPWIAAVDDEQVWVLAHVVPDAGAPAVAIGDVGGRGLLLLGAGGLIGAFGVQTLLAKEPQHARRRLRHAKRPPRWRKPAATGAAAVAAAAVAVGASALLVDTERAAVAQDTGVVVLGRGTSTLGVGVTDLFPGDSFQRTFELTNTGDIPLRTTGSPAGLQLQVTATASPLASNRSDGLQVQVDRCSTPWVAGGTAARPTYTCTGVTTTVVADRPLVGRTNLPTSMATYQPGGIDRLRVTVRLPDSAPPTMAGATTTATFSFVAEQRDGVTR